MSAPHPAPPRLSDTQDADIARYRALSGLAVAGLVLGLLSVLAVGAPVLSHHSGRGGVTSGVALWRISRPAALMRAAGWRNADCCSPSPLGRRFWRMGWFIASWSAPKPGSSPRCGSTISCVGRRSRRRPTS